MTLVVWLKLHNIFYRSKRNHDLVQKDKVHRHYQVKSGVFKKRFQWKLCISYTIGVFHGSCALTSSHLLLRTSNNVELFDNLTACLDVERGSCHMRDGRRKYQGTKNRKNKNKNKNNALEDRTGQDMIDA